MFNKKIPWGKIDVDTNFTKRLIFISYHCYLGKNNYYYIFYVKIYTQCKLLIDICLFFTVYQRVKVI